MKKHPEVRQFIAERIKEKRAQQAVTQEKLSELTEIDPTTISRYERGVLEPSPKALYDIACALGCQCGDFFPHAVRAAALLVLPAWFPAMPDLLPVLI